MYDEKSELSNLKESNNIFPCSKLGLSKVRSLSASCTYVHPSLHAVTIILNSSYSTTWTQTTCGCEGSSETSKWIFFFTWSSRAKEAAKLDFLIDIIHNI